MGELVDEIVGASSSLQGRNVHRTSTQRGSSSVQYQRQRKRPTSTQQSSEEDDQEDWLEQHSTIPNREDDDSDVANDDQDVTDDDEDPTSADQEGGDDNATIDEFDEIGRAHV